MVHAHTSASERRLRSLARFPQILMNRKSGRLRHMQRPVIVGARSTPVSRRSRIRGIAFASCTEAMADEQLEFGAELAQAREQRGITLPELARRTKIGIDALKARRSLMRHR